MEPEIAFIYNELDKDGNFKAIYYDSLHLDKHVKYVNNRERRLAELSNDQYNELNEIVPWFIGNVGGQTPPKQFNNKDHSLLLYYDIESRKTVIK